MKRTWGHELLDVDGFPLHVLAARDRPASRVVLYLHGGGYMFGPFATEWAAMRKVAAATGCDLAVLVYPKVPEFAAAHTVPVAIRAFQMLVDRYGAASNVILIGASAGGGLALALLGELRDAGEPMPSHVVLLSPGVDMTLEDEVRDREQDDVLVPVDHVRSAGELYAGDLGPRHPWVSPSFGNLSGLPPLYVFVGTSEILYPSTATFVARVTAAGTEAHLIAGEGQQHTWPLAPTPEGRTALGRIVEIVGVAEHGAE